MQLSGAQFKKDHWISQMLSSLCFSSMPKKSWKWRWVIKCWFPACIGPLAFHHLATSTNRFLPCHAQKYPILWYLCGYFVFIFCIVHFHFDYCIPLFIDRFYYFHFLICNLTIFLILLCSRKNRCELFILSPLKKYCKHMSSGWLLRFALVLSSTCLVFNIMIDCWDREIIWFRSCGRAFINSASHLRVPRSNRNNNTEVIK